MIPFEYAAPSTVEETLALLAERGAEAKVLAGGQSLVPLLNYRLARPGLVIDINRVPLDGVSATNGGSLRLGALTRHHRLVESAEIRRACPILAEAAALIGNVRVRSLGTLGGSLAHADPAAELPLVMIALDASLMAAGAAGRRAIPAREFFTGSLSTALASHELLVEITVPDARGMGAAIEEHARRAGDFGLVAVAALVRLDRGGRADHVSVAIGGVAPTPVRAPRAEDVLRGHEPTPERVALAAARTREDIDPQSDAFASAVYRAHLAGVLARRALTRALAPAEEAA